MADGSDGTVLFAVVFDARFSPVGVTAAAQAASERGIPAGGVPSSDDGTNVPGFVTPAVVVVGVVDVEVAVGAVGVVDVLAIVDVVEVVEAVGVDPAGEVEVEAGEVDDPTDVADPVPAPA